MAHFATSLRIPEYFFFKTSRNFCLKRLFYFWLVNYWEAGDKTYVYCTETGFWIKFLLSWGQNLFFLSIPCDCFTHSFEAVCSLVLTCTGSAILYFSDHTIYCCTQCCPLWGNLKADTPAMLSFIWAKALSLTYPKAYRLQSRVEILWHNRAIYPHYKFHVYF